MDTRLDALTERAYQVFGGYRVKQLKDVCTVCCIDKEEHSRLLAVSPSGLSCESLRTYATAAFASEPTYPDEFKHFLPRYLELLKGFESPCIPEVTFKRLKKYRDVEEWPDDELSLLNDFASALFAKALSSYPLQGDFTYLTSLLIMFDNGDFDTAPLLEQWQQSEHDTALLHLKELVLDSLSERKGYRLDDGFASTQLSDTVINWLTANRDLFCERLERYVAYGDFEGEDELLVDELSWAYEALKYHF